MGKFYYDLLAERENNGREDIALVRIEQLFPLHEAQLETVLSGYKNADRFVWAQEEPKNMGAWGYMLERFPKLRLEVASREYHAVPAAGSSARFKKRHQKVIAKVFD